MKNRKDWLKSKRLPFSRTLGQLSKKGRIKTFSMLLAVLMRHFIPSFRKKIKYVTYKYFTKKNGIISEINGSKMWLNLRDKGIGSDLFLYGKREPISTDYLMNSGMLKEGSVVLDIGANIGYYALTESRLVGDSGKVYAIEPVSSNIKYLKRNIKLNKYNNVEVFHLAVGDRNGKSKVYISAKSNLSAMESNLTGDEIVGVEDVDVVTVDSFLKDKTVPNLIRMDVEGYEYHIIKGMPNTLKENLKILMELHPSLLSKESLDEMLQSLINNNFKVQFFICEHNIKEHKIVQYLMRKGGENLPIVFLNITIDELSKILKDNPGSPHILFFKMQ